MTRPLRVSSNPGVCGSAASSAPGPDRLAVLADAGSQDAWLLGHLRGEGPHVRGCVAVDTVLGKA